MGILKNIFKKKDPLEELQKDLDSDLGRSRRPEFPDFSNEFGSSRTVFGEQQTAEITPPPAMQANRFTEARLDSNNDLMLKKDLEIISSKLDAIKASLESMNQRVANIERIAMSEDNENK